MMLRRLFSPSGSVQISCLLLFAGATLTGCRWGAVCQNTVCVQLFQQGRYAEALQKFESDKQSDPQNPEAYYNLASTYHRMGVSQKDAKLTEQAEALY
ncbi:MAG: tetratricopeptide repeat protein, partial [Pirellulaceae bacterium]